MKQIVVNVSGLSEEEKQRVNEALAKITGTTKLPLINNSAGWFFAPASSGSMWVTWGLPSSPETPTHTPQQVIEMAGMTEKRKVRADFDLTKEYSVDVSNCTEDEKKQVQQAFFNVGLRWGYPYTGEKYLHLGALQYSNSFDDGDSIVRHLLKANNTEGCNMTPAEFFELVYEPVQQGHVHADLMALYAEDAKTTDKPWRLWEFKGTDGNWMNPTANLFWVACTEYRRKPKTHIVHGVEIPDLRVAPKNGEWYYLVDPVAPEFTYSCKADEAISESSRVSRRLCYEYTDAGKQAAISHAKAWLGEGI